MHLHLRKETVKLITWIYTGLIILLVTLPINGKDHFLGKLNDNYVLQIRFDYMFHACLFIPLPILIWWGWSVSGKRKKVQVLTGVAVVMFAVLCEYIQLPLTYRTFNINDLVSNSLGVLLGWLCVWGWQRSGLEVHLITD